MAGLATNWYNVLQGKGLEVVQVVRVSTSGSGMPSQQELVQWRLANNAHYAVVRDVNGVLPNIHPLPEVVSTVIVDRHQQIRYQGRPSAEELLDMLQDLLAEE